MNEASQVRGHSWRYNGVSGYQAAPLGYSAWLYNGATTIDIGLTGPEHTRSDGYKRSESYQMNDAGQVRGSSQRFNGGSSDLGASVWFYNGTTTIDIGLSGPAYTRSDGFKRSEAYQMNEAGLVRGYSERYSGELLVALDPWLYDGATTNVLGLNGTGGLTGADGTSRMNESGQVLGQFEGSPYTTAWRYDGTTTIDIGPKEGVYTDPSGNRISAGYKLTESGKAIGTAHRFDPNAASYSGWVYDGVTTHALGFTDSEHTFPLTNIRYGDATDLNEAGQVIGYSERGGQCFLSGCQGRSAWFYNGTDTIRLGFTGAAHTRIDGYKYSEAKLLNQAGQVLGISTLFNNDIHIGESVWLYNGTTTIDLGQVGPLTFSGGAARHLNEAGQVTGVGVTASGLSAWFYDGATTTQIGLTGPAHTRNDGYQRSIMDPLFSVDPLNEAGQVIGVSERYNGGDEYIYFGQDAWLYDPLLDQTFALQLSVRSDGYAWSEAKYLGEDGLVLGTYTQFDALDNDLGSRVFYFTAANGLHDLGSLVDGGLTANGWENLAGVFRANDRGQILGNGQLAFEPSGGQMAYLLTPILPGDFNHDGTVDAADYVSWRKTGGSQGDYSTWRTNFGQSYSFGAGSEASAHAVPEPTTLILLLSVATGICTCRRRME